MTKTIERRRNGSGWPSDVIGATQRLERISALEDALEYIPPPGEDIVISYHYGGEERFKSHAQVRTRLAEVKAS